MLRHGWLVALGAITIATRGVAQATTACLPADSTADGFAASLAHIASASEPELVETRTRMQLPQVSAAQVALVSDPQRCARAAMAHNATLTRPAATPPAIYLVRVGTVFVAIDPARRFGQYLAGTVLSAHDEILYQYFF